MFMDWLADMWFTIRHMEWWWLVTLLALVAVIIFLVYIIVVGVKTSKEVNAFFEEYGADSGKVVGYGFEEPSTTTVYNNVKVGNITVSTPSYYTTDAKFFIKLECVNNGVRFIATYRIPEVDYKEYGVGSTVNVASDWVPYGYEVIEWG